MFTGLKEEKRLLFVHAFYTDELCSGRASIKLLPFITFLKINSSKVRPEISTAQSTKGNRAIHVLVMQPLL